MTPPSPKRKRTKSGPGSLLSVCRGSGHLAERRGRRRFRACSGPFRTSFTLPSALLPTLLPTLVALLMALLPLLNALVALLPTLLPFLALLPFLPLVAAFVCAPVVAHVKFLLPVSSIA
jgi:hypothetical protein